MSPSTVSKLNKKIPVSPCVLPQAEQVNYSAPSVRPTDARFRDQRAPSAGGCCAGTAGLENDPDRVRALVSVSRKFGRRVAPELERGFFLSLKSTTSCIGRSHNPSYRSPFGADGARRVHDRFFQSV